MPKFRELVPTAKVIHLAIIHTGPGNDEIDAGGGKNQITYDGGTNSIATGDQNDQIHHANAQDWIA